MFAIVENGCRQYRVEEGGRIRVDLLPVEIGAEVRLDKVLLLGGKKFALGRPYIEGAVVLAEVVEHIKDKKLIIFKKWRRNDSFRTTGHRQKYTTLKIKSIAAGTGRKREQDHGA